MKILKISGHQLTSLDSFEVDFTQEAFSYSGLFAITGPTGSGKSTLLDCICLALYGKTPRYKNYGGPTIGFLTQSANQRITANDPRSLLSHGAGEGQALVEFTGVDDKIYKAIWAVRRARGKPNGSYQNTTLELFSIDPESGKETSMTGANRRETRALVESKVGLSFEQFCRSVFLAQGEFDAFLKADHKERGELLQRMTGTDIYERLSKGAHRKYDEARSELKLQEQARSDLNLLTEEEESERRLKAKEVGAEIKRLERDRVSLEQNKALFDGVRRFEGRQRELRGAITEESHAQEETQAEYERALKLTQVAPLARLWRAQQRTLEEGRSLDAQAKLFEEEERSLKDEVTTEGDKYSALKARYLELGERWEQLAEVRHTLNQLEIDRDRLTLSRGEISSLIESKEAEVGHLVEMSTIQEEQIKDLSLSLEERTQWLRSNEYAENLAQDQSHWTDLIKRYQIHHQERVTLERERDELTSEVSRLTEHISTVGVRSKEVNEELSQIESDLASISLEDQVGASVLEQELSEASDALEAIDLAQITLRRCATLARQHEEATSVAESTQRDLEEAQLDLRTLEMSVMKSEVRLEEAQYSWSMSQTQSELAPFRDQLVDGEPCPLCGALEHPGIEESSTVHQTRLKARVEELKAAHQTHLSKAEDALTKYATLKGEGEANSRALERLNEELMIERSAWSQRVATARILEPYRALNLEEAEGVEERLTQLNLEVKETLDDLKRRAQERRHLHERQLKLTEEKLKILGRRDAINQELTEGENQRAKENAQLEHVHAGLKHVFQQLSSVSTQLSRYGQMERGETPTHAAQATQKHWLSVATHWRETQLSQGEIHAQVQQSHSEHQLTIHELKRTQESLSSAHIRLEEGKEEWRALQSKFQDHQEDRATLDQLHEERELTRQLVDEREIYITQKREEYSRSRSKAEESRLQAREQSVRVEQGAARLSESMLALELEESELAEVATQLEAVDDQELLREVIDNRQAAQERLLALRAKLEGIVEEAEALRQRIPEETEERELDGKLSSLKAVLVEAQGLRFSVQEQLKLHDQAMRDKVALDTDYLRAKSALKRWKVIYDLIGSKNGAKFRDFAQNLTLEMILEHANHFLSSLIPRYLLMMIPDQDLEFQVIDRDYGDEARSLHSLSGGESFLISLALALGLSSTTAQDIQIESLFIDEGFGTLDPNSLEVALSVLDNLQMTGRQIGVISHVDGLAERVGTEIEVRPVGGGRSIVMVNQRQGF